MQFPGNPLRVEVVRRGEVVFVINHGAKDMELFVDGNDPLLTDAPARGLRLPSQGVAIIAQ